MPHTIAIVGHSGLTGKPIVAALSKTEAHLKILHRKGSDIGNIDSTKVELIEIDYDDEGSITRALMGVDIFVSLLGGNGIALQHKFIKPIQTAGVKLFLPSDLGFNWSADEAAKIPFINIKLGVERALQAAKIPYVVIEAGGFAETLSIPSFYGIDLANNTVTTFGDPDAPIWLTSIPYIAAAFASLLPSASIPSLAERRHIAIYEVIATGNDIVKAVEAKTGTKPTVQTLSLKDAVEQQKALLESGSTDDYALLAAALHVKIPGGTANVREDVYEVPGYKKKTLQEMLPETITV